MAAGEQAATVKAALENLLKRDVKSHSELLQRKTQDKQSIYLSPPTLTKVNKLAYIECY